MVNNKRKTIQDYIDKYGPDKGPIKFEENRKRIEKRTANYKKHPFRRMTREWFIWRYGEIEGNRRADQHASKSAHTLENFIRLYGDVEGKIKYESVINKKNTIRQIRKKYPKEEAEERIKKRNESIGRKHKLEYYKEKYGDIEGEQKFYDNMNKRIVGVKTKIKGRPAIEKFINKHGEIKGREEYVNWLTQIYLGPKRITGFSELYARKLETYFNNLKEPYKTYIMDNYFIDYGERKEFIFKDIKNAKVYAPDVCLPKLKLALELDGSFWHPTEQEYNNSPDKLKNEISTKTIGELYESDLQKEQFISSQGFTIIRIRNDDNIMIQNLKFRQFLNLIEERLKEWKK